MKLNLILPQKKVKINQKIVTIPKLGLKHYNLLKDVKALDENMRILVDSIQPGLSSGEAELMVLHLLEFNGRMKDVVVKDGFTYKLEDIYICQRLSHQLNGITYNFRSPELYEQFSTPQDVLEKTYRAEGSEVPDFGSMPAFVIKWANSIVNTVAIKGPKGVITGSLNILEIFE